MTFAEASKPFIVRWEHLCALRWDEIDARERGDSERAAIMAKALERFGWRQ